QPRQRSPRLRTITRITTARIPSSISFTVTAAAVMRGSRRSGASPRRIDGSLIERVPTRLPDGPQLENDAALIRNRAAYPFLDGACGPGHNPRRFSTDICARRPYVHRRPATHHRGRLGG